MGYFVARKKIGLQTQIVEILEKQNHFYFTTNGLCVYAVIYTAYFITIY